MSNNQKATRIIIMGAAGRDFHNFNMVYRNDPDNDVIARLLKEKPQIRGLAVLGMPMGSPGMEGPRRDSYDVLALQENGKTSVFASQ